MAQQIAHSYSTGYNTAIQILETDEYQRWFEGLRDLAAQMRMRGQMTTPKTAMRAWDITRYLDSDETIAAYLDAVLEEDDPALLAAALGDVARAKGMTQVAREAGLGRESLYKALSIQGNPEFGTVLKVMRALGLKLRVSAQAPRE